MASDPSAVPALQDWTDDELMRRLARNSPDVWDPMLEETGTINSLNLRCKSPSSAGDLDRLSNETIVLALQHLDLQSLCRFMATSFRAMEIAESLPLYRHLLRHASPALIVLGKTNLASYHTVSDLYAAISSEECASCHRFGAFLFLPTCERACLNCLHRNMRFWVLPAKEAQQTYGIPQKEMHQLPTMMSIQVRKQRGRRKKFVSVKLARELGLKIHGSPQEMTAWVLQSGKLGNNLNQYSCWAEAGETLLEWNNDDGRMPPPRSTCWGSASVRFPHLRRDQRVDPGYWCEGCRFRRQQISEVSNYSHGMDYIGKSPEEEKELERRHRDELRDWSRPLLKEHVFCCLGAQELSCHLAAAQDRPIAE